MKQTQVREEPAGNLPLTLLKLAIAPAQQGAKREISISGNQVLLALTTGFFLTGGLVWAFVRYWLFAP